MDKNIVNNDIFIGDRIKTIRKNAKLTQSEFAKSINIKQATLSDIERCKIGLSTNLMFKILEKYHVNADWLLTGESSQAIYPVKEAIIDVAEARRLYYLDKNENVNFNLEVNLTAFIHNKLVTVSTLLPIIDKISMRIPKSNTGCHNDILDEIRSLLQQTRKKQFHSLVLGEKLYIISQLDSDINYMIHEIDRLTNIILKE